MNSSSPRRVLLLLVRDPMASRTGRMAVLESAVTSMFALGHQVTVVVMADGPEGTWMGLPVHRVSPPGLAGLPARAALGLIRGHALNEALFDGRAARAAVSRLVHEHRPDVVVGDCIRTWPALREQPAPAVMHLDDLLSDRYRSATFREGNDSVLGYFGDRVTAPLLGLANRTALAVLDLEAGLLHRREIVVAREAAVAAMTSQSEADILGHRAGRRVRALPMAVEPLRPGTPSVAEATSFAFLGVLHYGPNLAALRHLRDAVIPEARRRGIDLKVTAYGKHGDGLPGEFPPESGVLLAGYVEDLGEALRPHRGFLSPVLSGAGVKTKVLDAMSVGLPVVATTLGVEGIPAVPGRDVLVADTVAGFVDEVQALVEDPEMADRIGRAGRDLLISELSLEHVREAWNEAIEDAMAGQTFTPAPDAPRGDR